MPRSAPAYLLELWGSPCVRPEIYPTQRLIVRVNGTAIGAVTLIDHTVVAFPLPSALLHDGIRLQFDLPDAVDVVEMFGGRDGRLLGFSFKHLRLFRIEMSAAPPLLPANEHQGELLTAFENIGDNCEFGFVQRRAGLEPLGLLRFSGQPIRYLVRALDERFSAFDDLNALEIPPPKRGMEQPIFIRQYHMQYHTFIDIGEMEPAELIGRQRRRLQFLSRKLIEDIQDGRKIFVVKRNDRLHDSEILPIYAALQRIGRANMLVVRPADVAHPEGTVEVMMPGLFCGYINEFGPYGDVQVRSLDGWHTICRTTLEMATQP